MRPMRAAAVTAALAGSVLVAGALQAAAAAPTTIPVLNHTHRLQLNANQQSTNWSGWVNTSGGLGYTSASGTWTVPTVTPTSDDRYSSDWVGIGGDPTPDLVQAGTEQDSVGGKAQYYAWIEILPAPELQITNFPVSAGNSITVSIIASPPEVWTLHVHNNSNGADF